VGFRGSYRMREVLQRPPMDIRGWEHRQEGLERGGRRKLTMIIIEWEVWAMVAKFLGLKSVHPVDAIAERFLTTGSLDEALKQLVKGFTLFIRSAKHSKKRPPCGKGGKS